MIHGHAGHMPPQQNYAVHGWRLLTGFSTEYQNTVMLTPHYLLLFNLFRASCAWLTTKVGTINRSEASQYEAHGNFRIHNNKCGNEVFKSSWQANLPKFKHGCCKIYPDTKYFKNGILPLPVAMVYRLRKTAFTIYIIFRVVSAHSWSSRLGPSNESNTLYS